MDNIIKAIIIVFGNFLIGYCIIMDIKDCNKKINYEILNKRNIEEEWEEQNQWEY